MAESLSRERLLALLRYDPNTGHFTWLVSRGKAKAWDRAGTPHPHGYVNIMIDGRVYLAHRLAWFYVHGTWPEFEIDHRDTVKHHNWIDNLRDGTHAVNMQNQRRALSTNSTGMLGVRCKGRRFRAQIEVDGKTMTCRTRATPAEAHADYLEAKRRLHEGCTL